MSFFITLRGHFSLFPGFFERKAYVKVGKFTFVSTKLASKRAIKLSGSYSRLFIQSIAIKSISRHVFRARARREITQYRNASFASEKETENRSGRLVVPIVATTSTLVTSRAEQIII